MEFRSSNGNGYVHYQGDVVAGVASSHGVRLSGGSTGGAIAAIGDDANISLSLTAKGSGVTQIGSSVSPVQIGNSTAAIAGIFRYVVEYTPPAVEASSFTALSTITVAGLTTNAGLIFTPRTDIATPAPTTGGRVVIHPYCSTAGELKLVAYNQTGSTIAAQSTARGILTEFRF